VYGRNGHSTGSSSASASPCPICSSSARVAESDAWSRWRTGDRRSPPA
jgi:hypothetical protein